MDAAKHLSAPVIDPATDDMGEHEMQFKIAQVLVPLITTQERGTRVSGDQLRYFAKGQPLRCPAPDPYVVDDVAPSSPASAPTHPTDAADRRAHPLRQRPVSWS